MKQRKYFKLNSVFNSKKISANHENTSYIDPVSKLIVSGEPDILWQNIVFIEDIKKVWTHGNLYSGVVNKNIEDVDFETDKFSDFVPTSYNTAYNLNNITYILSGSINTVDNKKVDKEDGKQLSSNDYTTNEKNKLTNLKGVDVVNSSSTTIGSDVKIWIDTSKNYGELDPNQIVQTRGQSTTNVMSQKAVTDAIENPIDLIGTDGYYSLYYLKYNGRTIPVQHFEKKCCCNS